MKKIEVLIIGAGLAGAALAEACRRYGLSHQVLEQSPHAACAASGNRFAVLFPNLQAEFSPLSQFFYHAYQYAQALYQGFPQHIEQHWPGLWQWAFDDRQTIRQEKIKRYLQKLHNVSWHSNAEAAEQLGFAVPYSGLFWHGGGFVAPKTVAAALLHGSPQAFSVAIKHIERKENFWRVETDTEHYQAQWLLIATGADTFTLQPFLPILSALPWQIYRGQLTYLALKQALPWPQPVLCFQGYALLASPWELMVGSTYQPTRDFKALRPEDTQKNLAAAAFLPWLNTVNAQILSGRVAYRLTTKDRLPLLGEVSPGLYLSLGHGSRGLITAPLAAEMLIRDLIQMPPLLSPEQIKLLNAKRFFR